LRKTVRALLVAAVIAGLWWMFPPFHIRSLKATRAAQVAGQFSAADFVGRFWAEKLLPATTQAADVAKVLEVLSVEPQKVREQYGRTVGVSSSYFLFVRGAGRVVDVSEDTISLAVRSTGDVVDVSMPLGLVFGNAVRDGTGLLDASSYANAQEFNDISAALNSIVETNVLPHLQHMAAVGKRIQFAGCVEIGDEEQDFKPLTVVPVLVNETKE
jgi:predicted lipoprotein